MRGGILFEIIRCDEATRKARLKGCTFSLQFHARLCPSRAPWPLPTLSLLQARGDPSQDESLAAVQFVEGSISSTKTEDLINDVRMNSKGGRQRMVIESRKNLRFKLPAGKCMASKFGIVDPLIISLCHPKMIRSFATHLCMQVGNCTTSPVAICLTGCPKLS